MCGPLVAFAVGDPECRRWWSSRVGLNAAYHVARGVAYAIVGAACGAIGALVDMGAMQVGVYRAAAIVAGCLMIVVGIAAVLRHRGVRLPRLGLPQRVVGWIAFARGRLRALRPPARAACTGFITALLPCGWLYLFAVAAAGTGNPLSGMAVMAAFWLGSVPILMSLGLGAQAVAAAMGRRLPLITAAAMVALGVSTLVFRMQIPLEAMTARTTRTTQRRPAAERQIAPDPTESHRVGSAERWPGLFMVPPD